MKKIALFTGLLLFMLACKPLSKNKHDLSKNKAINKLLDQWHKDVAEYNYGAYFDKMTADAIFIGTDASEIWSKQEFMSFSKPFFDKKSTWDFKPLQRNIYANSNKNIAWFDELLDTWMGVCRGSGVIVYQDGLWKIQHYVLSVAVPNDVMPQVVKIKKKQDAIIIGNLDK